MNGDHFHSHSSSNHGEDSTSLSPTNLGCTFSIMKLYNCTYSQDYPNVKLIMGNPRYLTRLEVALIFNLRTNEISHVRWQCVDLNILIIVFSWYFSRAFLGLEIRFNYMKGLIHDLPWGHRTLRIFYLFILKIGKLRRIDFLIKEVNTISVY